VQKSFTLIEAILVIVVLSFILVGGFQIVQKLYVRNYIVKQVTEFEFLSQQTIDLLSLKLYNRIPLSVIGYNPKSGDFKYIGYINIDENYPVLEWIGYLNDAMKEKNLSGFADLYASKKPILKALDFNSLYINEILHNKYYTSKNLNDLTAIIFAGSFDRGSEEALNDYNDSFGWHNNKANLVYRIRKYNQIDNDCELNLTNYDGSEINQTVVYEKFYLVDSAYAIALKRDLNISKWNCDIAVDEFKDNDLLFFYNYRPWLGENFCGDGGEGNVTLLSENVNSFRIRKINSHIEIKIQLLKSKDDINISISKQKVAF
jgi:type II secretory pathway pseudopilin PulG